MKPRCHQKNGGEIFTPEILVLGIGNLLWADEGFGVRCAEILQEHWCFSPSVKVLDGGTQGLYLLPYVQEARRMIIFDAIDFGDPPGTLREIAGNDIPRFLGAKKMSLHQTGFQEVLALAALTLQLPEEFVLLGVQPLEMKDFGGSLSPVVRQRIPETLERALHWLKRWGATVQEQNTSASELPDGLRLSAYEDDRPDSDSACRTGDSRFLPVWQTKENSAA